LGSTTSCTGLVQDRWREAWSKTKPRPWRTFYESRCYRYERPQKGRYREFTQMGVEILGGEPEMALAEAKQTLVALLEELGLEYRFSDSVRRGLTYYTSPGFEVECDGSAPRSRWPAAARMLKASDGPSAWTASSSRSTCTKADPD
jgi:histidyl-tRNA synthetase